MTDCFYVPLVPTSPVCTLFQFPPGQIPPEVPGDIANATPCILTELPDEGLNMRLSEGQHFIERNYVHKAATPEHFVGCFPVNYAGETYDFALRHRVSEIEDLRLARTEIRIVNTGGQHRLLVEVYDQAGALQQTVLDYDATAEFSGGEIAWVIWRLFSADLELYLNGSQVFSNNIAGLQVNPWTVSEYEISNKQGEELIAFAQWNYTASIWACLTSSGKNIRLDGISLFDKNPTFFVNPAKSSTDIYVPPHGFSASGVGTAIQARNGRFTHNLLVGKKYFEGWSFQSENNAVWRIGGVRQGSALDERAPGSFLYSFGQQPQGGSVEINGNVVGNLINTVAGWAIDFDSGNTWIRDAEQADTWLDGIDPTQNPKFNIYSSTGLVGGAFLPYQVELAVFFSNAIVDARLISGEGAYPYSNGNPFGFGYVT